MSLHLTCYFRIHKNAVNLKCNQKCFTILSLSRDDKNQNCNRYDNIWYKKYLSVIWRRYLWQLTWKKDYINNNLRHDYRCITWGSITCNGCDDTNPYNKIHGANMGLTGPRGGHVGPVNLAIWESDIYQLMGSQPPILKSKCHHFGEISSSIR